MDRVGDSGADVDENKDDEQENEFFVADVRYF